MAVDPQDAAHTPDAAAGPRAGRVVGGRYRLGSVLGRGGMGVVWSGRDEVLGRPVAIKEVIPPSAVDDADRALMRARTMREARTAARISAESVVATYDVVEEDGRPWIVMERLPPRTLEDDIAATGGLPPYDVALIGASLLAGLSAAHAAGILHRDVKPSNVMFRDGPRGRRAVLTDFGIARFDGDGTLTSTGMMMGSPAYIAPERARGLLATQLSDLWSLGVTLWAALEGRSPFQRVNSMASLTAVITEEVPRSERAGPLQPVLDGLLHKDPADRIDAVTARRLLADVVADLRPPTAPVPVAPAPDAPAPDAPVAGPPATGPAAAAAAAPVPAATPPSFPVTAPLPAPARDRTPDRLTTQDRLTTPVHGVPSVPEPEPAPAATARQPAPARPSNEPGRSATASAEVLLPASAAGVAPDRTAPPPAPAAAPAPDPGASLTPLGAPTATRPSPPTTAGPATQPSASPWWTPAPAAQDGAATPPRRGRWLVPGAVGLLVLGLLGVGAALSQREDADPSAAGQSTTAADAADPQAQGLPDAGANPPDTGDSPAPDAGDGSDGATSAEDQGAAAGSGADVAADAGGAAGSEGSDDPTGTQGGTAGGAPAGSQGTDGAPASGTAAAPVPEGFQLHSDPTGFSVAVPAGWTVERQGPRVYLHDPASRAYLLVDQTDEPQPDPVADWQRQEPTVAQRMENYERLGEIGPVDYRGWQAADWEFVFGPGQATHVLNRNIVTSPDQAYALYWSVPSSQWEQLRPVHEQVLATFQPAG